MELLSTICVQTLQQQRDHAQRLKLQWRDGEVPDARAAIEEIGGSTVHKSVAIELAYEEFCQRKAAGEDIQPSRFAERFPALQHSLQRQIGIHQFLSQRGISEAEPLPDWPEAGDEVAGFLLKEELGRGAFGRVFLAHELKLRERTVVVKVARQGLREAQLLAQVSHPGIVPIYSAETDAEWGLTTICMPFNSRATLLDVLELTSTLASGQLDGQVIQRAVVERNCSDDPLTLLPHGAEVVDGETFAQAVIHFARLLADSLGFAHSKGVQHRDLKPSNILVNSAGQPLLIDFNLSTEPASEDYVGGTLPYMSPEQLMAVLATGTNSGFEFPLIDPRSDIYSLGVCLYELWNGHHPLGEIPHELNQMELADYLLERQAIGPAIGRQPADEREAALQALIHCCLSWYADERPESADELLTALEEVEHIDATVEQPRSVWSQSWVAVLATMLVAIAAALMWAGQLPRADVPVARDFEAEATQLISNGEFARAADVLDEAIRIRGDDEYLLTLRGRTSLELARYSAAFDDFQEAYRISPSTSSATFAAFCAASQGKFAGAVDWYLIAVEDRPGSFSIRNNLGYALLKTSRYTEAVEQLDAAIKLDPDHQAPRVSRAIAHDRISEITGAPISTDVAEDLSVVPYLYGNAPGTQLTLARICAKFEPAHHRLRGCLVEAMRQGADPKTIKQDPAFNRFHGAAWFEKVLSYKLSTVNYDERRLVNPW